MAESKSTVPARTAEPCPDELAAALFDMAAVADVAKSHLEVCLAVIRKHAADQPELKAAVQVLEFSVLEELASACERAFEVHGRAVESSYAAAGGMETALAKLEAVARA